MRLALDFGRWAFYFSLFTFNVFNEIWLFILDSNIIYFSFKPYPP